MHHTTQLLGIQMCRLGQVKLKEKKAMFKQLEQLNAQELNYLHDMIDTDLNEMALALFPDAPKYRIALTEKIGQWVINRKTVLEFTAENKPEIAIIFNKVCHRIWQQLPEYARTVSVRVE